MLSCAPVNELLELAKRQHGVLSRTQALESGFSKAQIHTRLARREWNRELPGVFRIGWAPLTTLQRVWCVALWAGPEALVSHGTAAWLWGFADEPQVLEVSCPGRLSPPQPWVRAHQTPLPAHVHAVHQGIALTSSARTLFDIAAELDTPALDAALERALRQNVVTLDALTAQLADMPPRGRAGTGRMARALERLAPQASPDDSLKRRALALFREARLAAPQIDFTVLENGFDIARVDFAWPEERIVVELVTNDLPSSREVMEANTRHTALSAHGWHVVKLTWKDVGENAGAFVRSLEILLSAKGATQRSPDEHSIRAVARSAIATLIGDRR